MKHLFYMKSAISGQQFRSGAQTAISLSIWSASVNDSTTLPVVALPAEYAAAIRVTMRSAISSTE
jgi:hypothetical protein